MAQKLTDIIVKFRPQGLGPAAPAFLKRGEIAVNEETATLYFGRGGTEARSDEVVSIVGAPGQDGKDGKDGEDGAGFTILDVLDDISELPSVGNLGDCYIINGDLWAWSVNNEWVNGGSFQGPTGAEGPAGPQGATGATGAQGPQGIQGATGAQGPQGIQGDKGDKGDKGDTGNTGAQGIQGIQGPTGATGAQGATLHSGSGVPSSGLGSNGDYYLNTANGDVYTKTSGSWGSPISNFKGPTGAQGATGNTGAQGIQGVKGDKGDKGDTGDTGAQGVQGIEGPQGIQGPPGTGDMVSTQNLNDVANKATARENLGVKIGSDVQAYDVKTAKLNGAQYWEYAQYHSQATITSAATITLALVNGNDFSLALGHNATLANPSDIGTYVGMKGSISGSNNASYTLSYGSYWFPIGAASAPAIPTGSGAKFRIDFHVVSSTRIDFSVSSVGV